jgi:N-acyl-D-amino-acid deacylase
MSWEEAIRKSSALPAATIGMIDRGMIAVGMAADIVVFDPATVIDRATYENPALPSEGIRHVLVNGKVALTDGAATGTQGGVALRRGPSMPSRSMSSGAHRVAATTLAAYEDITLTLNVSQRAGARAATGTFAITGGAGIRTITATEFGALQVANGWISVTGRGVVNDGSERAFALTVDRHQQKPPGVAMLALTIDGAQSHSLHLASVTIQ